MPQPWRLLVDGVGAGPWNMAVDEALLASVVVAGPPTLRFYRWRGPWLSLGYRQRLDAEQLAACAHGNVGVVRRMTGGRAVLHGEDLTYAVVAREAALPAGLSATYAFVAEALQAALASLEVATEPAARPARERGAPTFDCFAEAAGDELCAGGRKLVGSAQRRAGGGVLQHGSIRLAPDPPAVRRAAGLQPGAATSLSELGVEVSIEALVSACRTAFERCLGVGLERAGISPLERRQARERESARAAELPISIDEPPQGASRVRLDGR